MARGKREHGAAAEVSMKQNSDIPYFKVEGERILVLIGGDEWRIAFLGLGVTIAFTSIAWAFAGLTGDWSASDWLRMTKLAFLIYSFMALVFFLLTVWPLGGSSSCRFDRASQAIHFASRRYKYSLPWQQVHFRAQWFPSKTGLGSTMLLVLGGPPFPEQVLPKNPKRLRKFLEQGEGALGLGSIPAKDGEDASRWENFLNAFMETEKPAEELYRRHVVSEGLGNHFSGLADF